MENKSSLLGFIFLLIGIFIGVFKPFQPELGAQGHYVLMLLLITIGLWILSLVDYHFRLVVHFLWRHCWPLVCLQIEFSLDLPEQLSGR